MRGKFLSVSGKGPILGSRGATFHGCLLFFLVLVAIAWIGVTFGEAGWNYLQVRQKTLEALNWAVAGGQKPDPDIVDRVISNAREVDVDLPPRNVRVVHTKETLTIRVAWRRDVDLPFYSLPLNFKVSLTEVKRWERGNLVVK